jgi:hypothetical protein
MRETCTLGEVVAVRVVDEVADELKKPAGRKLIERIAVC